MLCCGLIRFSVSYTLVYHGTVYPLMHIRHQLVPSLVSERVLGFPSPRTVDDILTYQKSSNTMLFGGSTVTTGARCLAAAGALIGGGDAQGHG